MTNMFLVPYFSHSAITRYSQIARLQKVNLTEIVDIQKWVSKEEVFLLRYHQPHLKAISSLPSMHFMYASISTIYLFVYFLIFPFFCGAFIELSSISFVSVLLYLFLVTLHLWKYRKYTPPTRVVHIQHWLNKKVILTEDISPGTCIG